MAFEDTWIPLFRSMLSWEWYKDSPTKVVFLHLLLIVNIEPQRRSGHVIPAGAIDRTQQQLAEETGLSRYQVQRALKKLEETGEAHITRHSKFSVIVLNNWTRYQVSRTSLAQSSHNARTMPAHLNNNINNIKKENIYRERKSNATEEAWNE